MARNNDTIMHDPENPENPESESAKAKKGMKKSVRTKGKKCVDHLGNEYPSLAAMLRTYGIPDISYRYRLKEKHWSLEKTLTTPIQDMLKTTAIKCKDHLGNEFASKRDMCDYWRIPRNTFFNRIRSGWDIESALTTPIKCTNKQRRMIFDHLGNEFENVDKMCEWHNISKEQYLTNIRNGLSIERALTERTKRTKHPKDHLGNEFPSINAMCAHYGITKTTLRCRLELGWDLQSILEHPEDNSKHIKCKDHEGREFKTQKDMLEYHGIAYAKYKHRVKRGLDLDKCLSSKNLRVECHVDHHGNRFECLGDMVEYWCINNGTYHKHKKDGADLKTCLLGMYHTNLPLPDGMRVTKVLALDKYIVKYHGEEYVLNDIILYKYARKARLDEYLSNHNHMIKGTIRVKKSDGFFYEITCENTSFIATSDTLFELVFFTSPKVVPEIVTKHASTADTNNDSVEPSTSTDGRDLSQRRGRPKKHRKEKNQQ